MWSFDLKTRLPAFELTFHPFPRLPFELQQLIWSMALPQCSIICTSFYLYDRYPSYCAGPAVSTLDILARIRHPAMPQIRPMHFRFHGGYKHTVHVRPNNDILFFDCMQRPCFEGVQISTLTQETLRKIAIPREFLLRLSNGRFGNTIKNLKNLKALYVVLGSHRLEVTRKWSDAEKLQCKQIFETQVKTWREDGSWPISKRAPELICVDLRFEPIDGTIKDYCFLIPEKAGF